MLTNEATIRSIIADPHAPGSLLISFRELAAYYRVDGALAVQLRAFTPGTRLRFTHDAECCIKGIERHH